jgi:hypothetical protein
MTALQLFLAWLAIGVAIAVITARIFKDSGYALMMIAGWPVLIPAICVLWAMENVSLIWNRDLRSFGLKWRWHGSCYGWVLIKGHSEIEAEIARLEKPQ